MFFRNWLLKLFPVQPTNLAGRHCVKGQPTIIDGWKINYQNATLPLNNGSVNYIVDPHWSWTHYIDAVHLGWPDEDNAYGEFKCQYICNADEKCGSFVGYQIEDPKQALSGLSCYFYDNVVGEVLFLPQPADSNRRITHAYNYLCDEFAEYFEESYRDSQPRKPWNN